MSPRRAPVIDIRSRRPWQPEERRRIIRLAPELDGLDMLYSNDNDPERLFSIKILFWALRANGEVVGLVPWLGRMVACPDIRDPLNGQFEGYYDAGIEDVFDEPPAHKRAELEAAAEYYHVEDSDADTILQELPDDHGTHAVLTGDGFRSLTLIEVHSWRLYGDGRIHGMLIDDDRVSETPVLPGDDCLYAAEEHPDFRYFFQHRIANKIKEEDPDALAALALLREP